MSIEQIAASFIHEPVTDITGLDGGHVNRSYLVTGRDRYVLQSLNRRLYDGHIDAIEDNYMSYVRACEASAEEGIWFCPEWLRDGDGSFFHRDKDGGIWRMYRYIPSEDPADENGRPDPYKAGVGLGRLHRILKKCDGIADIGELGKLHDLLYHYNEYCRQDSSKMPRIDELDTIISEGFENMMSIRPPMGYIIHGDAKVSNMIFDGGEAAGFIDIDQITKGSVFDDLADCARSCCTDDEGSYDFYKVAMMQKGYEDGADTTFTKDAVELLGRVLVCNSFMLGLRYYTDYLAGGDHFAGLTPKQKLIKAADNLLAFV